MSSEFPLTPTTPPTAEPAADAPTTQSGARETRVDVSRERLGSSHPPRSSLESDDNLPALNLRVPKTSDTLLSAATPAELAELELEDKVRSLGKRLMQLETRVERVEERHVARARLSAGTGWVLFLAALVLGWWLFSRTNH